jgi:hypothetical protein
MIVQQTKLLCYGTKCICTTVLRIRWNDKNRSTWNNWSKWGWCITRSQSFNSKKRSCCIGIPSQKKLDRCKVQLDIVYLEFLKLADKEKNRLRQWCSSNGKMEYVKFQLNMKLIFKTLHLVLQENIKKH